MQSRLVLANGSYQGPVVITVAVAEGNRCSGRSPSARAINLRRRTQSAMGMLKYTKMLWLPKRRAWPSGLSGGPGGKELLMDQLGVTKRHH